MGPQGYKADLRSRGRNGNCSGGSEGQNLTSNLYATSGVPNALAVTAGLCVLLALLVAIGTREPGR